LDSRVTPRGTELAGHRNVAPQRRPLAQLPFARARFAEARADGHLVGHAYCAESQRPTQVLVDMNVAVAPAWRRRQVATGLVALVFAEAAPSGLVYSGTTTGAGAAFAESLDMKLGLTQEHYRLDLARADVASLQRLARVPDGYQLLEWRDR
jgi:GNAT superfamily N-acetyltransferase